MDDLINDLCAFLDLREDWKQATNGSPKKERIWKEMQQVKCSIEYELTLLIDKRIEQELK